jgi:hypothetical protein
MSSLANRLRQGFRVFSPESRRAEDALRHADNPDDFLRFLPIHFSRTKWSGKIQEEITKTEQLARQAGLDLESPPGGKVLTDQERTLRERAVWLKVGLFRLVAGTPASEQALMDAARLAARVKAPSSDWWVANAFASVVTAQEMNFCLDYLSPETPPRWLIDKVTVKNGGKDTHCLPLLLDVVKKRGGKAALIPFAHALSGSDEVKAWVSSARPFPKDSLDAWVENHLSDAQRAQGEKTGLGVWLEQGMERGLLAMLDAVEDGAFWVDEALPRRHNPLRLGRAGIDVLLNWTRYQGSPLDDQDEKSVRRFELVSRLAALADLEGMDTEGNTCLHARVSTLAIFEIRALLAWGADPLTPNARGQTFREALADGGERAEKVLGKLSVLLGEAEDRSLARRMTAELPASVPTSRPHRL